MATKYSDVFEYHAFRTHDGRIEQARLAVRNGQTMLSMPPDVTEPSIMKDANPGELHPEIVEEICENLSATERRTWLRIIDLKSIPDIAREDGVSHAAIYERIRGKAGKGGMIRKNRYVARWWALRQSHKSK